MLVVDGGIIVFTKRYRLVMDKIGGSKCFGKSERSPWGKNKKWVKKNIVMEF